MTPASIKHYSVGFLMNEEPATGLALVKPSASALLNGISGLVEPGETPRQRIIRASLQSFGVTPEVPWTPFATLRGPRQESNFLVLHYFYARSTKTLSNIRQIGKDIPVKLYVAELQKYQTLSNIQWLVPMALSLSKDPITESFIINEKTRIQNKTPFDEPAQWRREGTTLFLKHILSDCASVAYLPDEHPLVGEYLWTAHVCFDCRVHTSTPIQGRAFSLTEAKHIVETLLVSTRTLESHQLPAESDVQAIQ